MNVVFIVYYFPPINSSGAKRIEAISKYLAAENFNVTVLTPRKTRLDGEFTEHFPAGVQVIEMDKIGKISQSVDTDGEFEPMYTAKPSWKRRFKDFVMRLFGQVPDPRLPFALTFASPFLDKRICSVLKSCDVVIGSAPPWAMLLAAVICKKRFNVPCILDYRDQFSECHEMPGGAFAKWLELRIDRWLVGNGNHLVAISEPMSAYYRTLTANVSCILNGYDHQVLDNARSKSGPVSRDKIVIRYMGIVSPGRVPHNLMKALVRLKAHDIENFKKLSVEFYGNAALVDDAIKMLYPSIKEIFFFGNPVPYLDSLKLIVEADYLLFSETSSNKTLSAQGILTTKLFEYMGAGRPILGDISETTLAGTFLKKGSLYNIVGDTEDIFFDALASPGFYARKNDFVSDFARGLSRQSQAFQYADLIKSIVTQR